MKPAASTSFYHGVIYNSGSSPPENEKQECPLFRLSPEIISAVDQRRPLTGRETSKPIKIPLTGWHKCNGSHTATGKWDAGKKREETVGRERGWTGTRQEWRKERIEGKGARSVNEFRSWEALRSLYPGDSHYVRSFKNSWYS